MFERCFALISLPDLSKWNISNIANMSYMFKGCNSLISLPDLSKWKTSNGNYMRGMFNECISLISLPDTSKLNTSSITIINNLVLIFKLIILINALFI